MFLRCSVYIVLWLICLLFHILLNSAITPFALLSLFLFLLCSHYPMSIDFKGGQFFYIFNFLVSYFYFICHFIPSKHHCFCLSYVNFQSCPISSNIQQSYTVLYKCLATFLNQIEVISKS